MASTVTAKTASRLDQARQKCIAGDLKGAEALCREMLAASPTAPAFGLLGQILTETRHAEEAQACFSAAMRLEPEQANWPFQLGNLYRSQQRNTEAEGCYRAALALDRRHDGATNNLGLTLLALGRAAEAVECFSAWVRRRSGEIAAHVHLGIALQECGRYEEAEEAYRTALRLDRCHAGALNNLSLLLKAQGRLDEARQVLERLLSVRPEDVAAWHHLALVHQSANRLEDACQCLGRATSLAPEFAAAWNTSGSVFRALGELDRAARSYQKALALDPASAETLHNYANLLEETGNYKLAGQAYDAALHHRPDFVQARISRALLWLRAGDFVRGFPEFEWRFRSTSQNANGVPLWDGSDPRGLHLWLRCEQGLGDTIQFVRYALLLKEQGAEVTVECQPELGPLLTTSGFRLDPGDRPCDAQAWLMSLPRLCGTRVDSIPAPARYLRAEAIAEITEAIPESTSLRVGLVWAGNPKHSNDRNRTCRIAPFASLVSVPGTVWYSLQVGVSAPDFATLHVPPGSRDLSPMLRDFAHTAAALDRLDLVITVDTAVAHLAGALGRPTWLLVPFSPDWRWQLGREDSPWYPSMRLFRQPAWRQWGPVFARVRQELERLATR